MIQSDRRTLHPYRYIMLASGWILLAMPIHQTQAAAPLRGNPLDGVEIPAPSELASQPQPTPVTTQAPPPSQEGVQNLLAQRLTIRNFDVSGARTLPFAEISAILEPLAGRTVTVSELASEVNRITELYQQQGYLLSFAMLQQQDFADGLVKVTVVEGYIGEVLIQGEDNPAVDRLDTLAQALVDEKPLTRSTLERTLGLMRAVPGIRITPKLDMPRRASGATDLVLDVSHQAYALSGGVTNLGGNMQGIVSVNLNSLTPLGEQTRLTAAIPTASRSVRYYQGEITVPIGADGLALEVSGYHYKAEPEDAQLESLGYTRKIYNERLDVGLTYPLLLDNTRRLDLRAGFYGVQTLDDYTHESGRLWLEEKNRLRVARVELRYQGQSATQSHHLRLGMNQGFDAFGASKSLTSSAPGALEPPAHDLDFKRYHMSAEQNWVLPAQFGLTLAGTAQYSSDILPSIEQISFGSWNYGLGYPQGELAGDKGYGIAATLRRRFVADLDYLKVVEPYLRLDHARAWYNAPAWRVLEPRRLASVALGMKLTDDRRYLLDINIAQPVGDRPIGRDDRRPRVNANYSLFYQ